jgi:thymidylate kinase
MKRGLLIGLEGVDCSGKSTQALLLEKNIKNRVLLRFP